MQQKRPPENYILQSWLNKTAASSVSFLSFSLANASKLSISAKMDMDGFKIKARVFLGVYLIFNAANSPVECSHF